MYKRQNGESARDFEEVQEWITDPDVWRLYNMRVYYDNLSAILIQVYGDEDVYAENQRYERVNIQGRILKMEEEEEEEEILQTGI